MGKSDSQPNWDRIFAHSNSCGRVGGARDGIGHGAPQCNWRTNSIKLAVAAANVKTLADQSARTTMI